MSKISIALDCGQNGVWLDIPATADELKTALERIGGVDNPYFIGDYRTDIVAPHDTLRGIFVGGDINEVNYLAARLASLPQERITVMEAVMETPGALSNIAEMIDFTFNPDFHEFLPDVYTEDGLGEHYLNDPELVTMPEYLKNCVDLYTFGMNIDDLIPGVFTSRGYLAPTGEDWQEVFEANRVVPPEYVIDNHLATVEKSTEASYSQIDGQLNNAPPRRPDLTDGQTYDEIAELIPEKPQRPEKKPSLMGRLASAVKEATAKPGAAKEKSRSDIDL